MDWLCDRAINSTLRKLAAATPGCMMIGARDAPAAPKCIVGGSFYFESLRAHGMAYISQWTQGIDLSCASLLVFPVFYESHWSMCTVYLKTRICVLMDSLRPLHKGAGLVLLKHSGIDAVVYSPDAAQQSNASDCGVYALYFAKCVLEGTPEKIRCPVPREFIAVVRGDSEENFSNSK